jgi:cell wall assembly regulator SMI1
MPLRFASPKPPTSESAVAAFEESIGATLPADYRAFLLAHNGGRPKPELFDIRWDDPELASGGSTSRVDVFRSLGEGSLELTKAVRAFHGRIPIGMLPIATDPFGNEVLLGLDAARRGQVFFWLHDLPPEYEETDPATLGFVAPSFDEFVASLREDEDD